ncbi:hypothetical protein [Pseudonocardia aurantiaca]|uniref:Uncharacterized protein n=1 Tax=Pseudonocardia aurantiaca TaxID=75290 RepID=A0ABW4FW80_9PSEU
MRRDGQKRSRPDAGTRVCAVDRVRAGAMPGIVVGRIELHKPPATWQDGRRIDRTSRQGANPAIVNATSRSA